MMTTRREFLTQAAGASVAAAAASPAVAQSITRLARRTPGVVQTVQGPIDASKLGFTLPHEHIFASSAGFMQTWPEFFVLEIERGIEGTDIKPGVIKVATDREGVTPFVDKALRAAARASKATGAPVTTHTLAAERVGEKQAAIFEAEGLNAARVCLGHSDDTDDMTYLTGLAKRGYTIGMDHMTWGARAASGAGAGILSWRQRAQSVKKLVDAGLTDRIFLSNDWYFGISIAGAGAMEALEKMNPDGMLFSIRKTIPYLKQLGVTDQAIRTITVENPRRFFGGF